MMIETKVLTAEGQDLGVIKRVALSEDGCIRYIVLSSHGRLIPIPWKVLTVAPDRHAVVVQINRTILEKAPVIHSGQWTQINEEQVERFFSSHLSRGKEQFHERQERAGERGTSKFRGKATEQGEGSFREPAAAGQKLKEKPEKQTQPPSSSGQEKMRDPSSAKESMKEREEKQRPPATVPGQIQRQRGGEGQPSREMKQRRPEQGRGQGPAMQKQQSEEQGKPGSKKVE